MARFTVPGMDRTDRLYAIVEELRAVAPQPRSARWLAERFEVSTRTIERDASALQQSGVAIYAEPGRRGGYGGGAPHRLCSWVWRRRATFRCRTPWMWRAAFRNRRGPGPARVAGGRRDGVG